MAGSLFCALSSPPSYALCTIDGAIAINRVYDALDGRGFLPLASCCSLSSLAACLPCLCCFVLKIVRVFRVYVVVVVVIVFVVVVVGLGATAASFRWLLVRIRRLLLA